MSWPGLGRMLKRIRYQYRYIGTVEKDGHRVMKYRKRRRFRLHSRQKRTLITVARFALLLAASLACLHFVLDSLNRPASVSGEATP